MITKIGRKRFLEKYPDFPTVDYRNDNYSYPEVFDNCVLAVDYKTTRGLCKSLSVGLAKLISLLGYNSLYFLPDNKTPWLYRVHDYKPVKAALNYLADQKISKSFNGAIYVESNMLTEFTKNLFWLVRCNGVLSTPHFSDPQFNIIGSICKYGNIHLSSLNEEADIKLKEILSKTDLCIYEGESCGGEKIVGRTIII